MDRSFTELRFSFTVVVVGTSYADLQTRSATLESTFGDRDGSLVYKNFSKVGFLEDLASCKAVMATAGFTLMTESFYLHKPYLALPMRGQFEQELNAFWMAKLNYGINLKRIRSEAVGNFLYRLPDYEEKLNDYHAVDNKAIKAMLAELLDNNCELVKAYHFRRK